jgi:hypothetical protein
MFLVFSRERKKFVKRSSKHPNRYPFNPTMVKLMAESRVFIYPELLPTLAIFQSEPGIIVRFSFKFCHLHFWNETHQVLARCRYMKSS